MSKAERQLEDFEKVFKALAHASRRNILVVLKTREKMTAGEIVERFTHKWPTITRHLKQLEDAGLVQVRKVSREQYYSLNTKRLTGVVNEWLKWF
ncbi:metalloregulator ArsR/SmtB family transcription factor [Fulvivirgaceae bacterium BMA12]|uniref:Metalloregulator ArsR/SmtB family transcription factor n=1 Tax=Agaribacillus aureus TaxID=3051825 RepID=A0ABT8L9E6_9BACT|nr:metalloregulator ArsR/SmtB family transcription factor [Fulvivirgaceae bacterium BMA12]